MTLTPGTQLGPYKATAPLGKGGMGEVWRARDTKLDRDVAIKVLPDLMARDKERGHQRCQEGMALPLVRQGLTAICRPVIRRGGPFV